MSRRWLLLGRVVLCVGSVGARRSDFRPHGALRLLQFEITLLFAAVESLVAASDERDERIRRLALQVDESTGALCDLYEVSGTPPGAGGLCCVEGICDTVIEHPLTATPPLVIGWSSCPPGRRARRR